MNQAAFRIAAIGELLWDLLPQGPALGGAPANFAAMSAELSSSQDTVHLISRVGEDALGERARAAIRARGIDTTWIEHDPEHATGVVQVALGRSGPAYAIAGPSAWDFLRWTPELEALAPTLDAICFGTLSQRSADTRATLRRVVESTHPQCLRVFDVNLRSPFWTAEALAWSCGRASLIKMNHDEAPLVAESLGAAFREPEPLARWLLRQFPVKLVAITRGSQGSFMITAEEVSDHPGISAVVADTIGAGDAFTAGLVYALLRRWPLRQAAELANRLGAWAAAQPGGMPDVDGGAMREWFRGIEG